MKHVEVISSENHAEYSVDEGNHSESHVQLVCFAYFYVLRLEWQRYSGNDLPHHQKSAERACDADQVFGLHLDCTKGFCSDKLQ